MLLSDQIYRTCTWFSESCLHSISCSIQPSSSVMFFFSSVMVAIFHFCNYSRWDFCGADYFYAQAGFFHGLRYLGHLNISHSSHCKLCCSNPFRIGLSVKGTNYLSCESYKVYLNSVSCYIVICLQ